MLSVERTRANRSKAAARITTVMALAGALMLLPGLLSQSSNTVSAGCFIDGVPLSSIVERIDVCRDSENSFSINFTPQAGVGTFHSSCGDAGVHATNTTNGFSTPTSSQPLTGNYTISTSVTNPEDTVFVGFRVFGYLGESQDAPRKVHSSLSFNPADFSYDGQCIQIF